VSLAALIAAQRAEHGIPHVVSCRALGVSQAGFYKWRRGDGSPRRQRRKALAATISYLFHKHKQTYGSPRVTAYLRDMGWQVSPNTVAALWVSPEIVEASFKLRPAGWQRFSRTRPEPATPPSCAVV
jgi:putative transposase